MLFSYAPAPRVVGYPVPGTPLMPQSPVLPVNRLVPGPGRVVPGRVDNSRRRGVGASASGPTGVSSVQPPAPRRPVREAQTPQWAPSAPGVRYGKSPAIDWRDQRSYAGGRSKRRVPPQPTPIFRPVGLSPFLVPSTASFDRLPARYGFHASPAFPTQPRCLSPAQKPPWATMPMHYEQRSFRDEILEENDLPVNVRTALEHIGAPTKPPANVVLSHVLGPAPRCADTNRYWDKRRVQNLLRRFLEAIEEVSQGDLAGFLEHGAKNSADAGGGDEGVTEEVFVAQMERAGAWPSELTRNDKAEIFTALTCPTSLAALHHREAGRVPATVTRNQILKGLKVVPFNVPDFPVPLESGVQASDQEVYRQLLRLLQQKGFATEVVHDFTTSGLVSLEELQALLPQLVPLSALEHAVLRILRDCLPRLTHREQNAIMTAQLAPALRKRAADPDPDPHLRPVRSATPRDGRDRSYSAEPEHATPRMYDRGACSVEPPPPYGDRPALVNWYSGTEGAVGHHVEDVRLEDDLSPRTRVYSMAVLQLHPNDTVGPFLLEALLIGARHAQASR